jgi:hypothetical protein
LSACRFLFTEPRSRKVKLVPAIVPPADPTYELKLRAAMRFRVLAESAARGFDPRSDMAATKKLNA